MGISASQARLLSITARLTSNEYETQQLSNAKMRLAMKSQEANKEYIAALSATSLQYVSYDAHGSQITQDLTANILYNYSGFKNQYMISNAAGQAMVLSLDAKNFRKSKNLDEFLGCYGVEKVYKTDSLAKNAELLSKTSQTGGVKDYYTDWANAIEMAKNANYAEYEVALTGTDNYYELQYDQGSTTGYFKVNHTNDPYSYVAISSDGTKTADERYQEDKIYFRNLYAETSNAYYNALFTYRTDGTADSLNAMKGALEEFQYAQQCLSFCSSFDNWAKWKASISTNGQIEPVNLKDNFNTTVKNHINQIINEELAKVPNQTYDGVVSLKDAVAKTLVYDWGIVQGNEESDSKNKYALEIVRKIKEYLNNQPNKYEAILKSAQPTEVYTNVQKYYDVLNEFLAEAEELGCSTLEDTYQYNDPEKAQWYTNLWYQMNGESSYKSAIGDNETNFVALDSQLANSAEWVKNAISQGLITISVSSNTKAFNDLNTNITYNPLIQDIDVDDLMSNPLNITLKGISWKAIEYTSAGDFVEKDDTRAVAKAQAEYERITNEIAIKDKKYESKIKTLDTEHNALQQQYSSVKAAMDKNIDRSYRTFNG